MIFEISCSIFKKKTFIFFKFSLFQNSHFWVFLIFGKKHPKITKVVQKTAKIINLPYYLSNFIKKKSTFRRWPFFSDLWHGIALKGNFCKRDYVCYKSMMLIFFDIVYIIVLFIWQVLQKKTLGQMFFLGPQLLRKVANMQKI